VKVMRVMFLGPINCIHVIRWANAISRRGHELTIVTMHDAIQELDNNIDVVKLPFKAPLGYYLNARKVNTIINNLKPDLIHVHQASGHGTLARLSINRPYLLSVYGADVLDVPFKSKFHFNLIKKNIEKAKIVASTSVFMADMVTRTFNYNKQIPVTPFGVDINNFRPQNQESLDDKIKIGIVKRLERKYGVEYLVEAFHLTIKKLKTLGEDYIEKRLELIIVGKGSLLSELKDQVVKLNIEDRVHFLGRVNNEEVPNLLNSFEIFCVPSVLDSESFGVAAVEASACGLPVIASNAGGLKEVILDGETGYIVEKRNANQLSDKIVNLLLDAELRKELGNNGRNRVIENYDWEKNVDDMEELYVSLVQLKNNYHPKNGDNHEG